VDAEKDHEAGNEFEHGEIPGRVGGRFYRRRGAWRS